MVSQELVELAMDKINEPCTTGEIAEYLITNKMIERPKWDIRLDISGVLRLLKKWLIADKLPQGHTKNMMSIWYLLKWNIKHDHKTCKICKLVKHTHDLHIYDFVTRRDKRRVRNHGEEISQEEFSFGYKYRRTDNSRNV